MGNIIFERLTSLREVMKSMKADWIFSTSDDFHASEYVADYFKVREHYSGFTGENAFLLINATNAYMWTDGRFFLQCETQLKDTGVELMKMGEPGVPTVAEFVKANVKAGDSFYFDGRMVSSALGKKVEDILLSNGAKLIYDKDILGDLWTDRPKLPSSKLTVYGTDVMGEDTKSKLSRIRKHMEEKGCDYHFIASLDDTAWITNVRGNDIECNPVFLAYMLITKDSAVCFMQKSEADPEVTKYLKSNGIEVKDYDSVIDFLLKYNFKGKVLLDEANVNFASFKTISSKAEIVNSINPARLFKAVKNETEIERLKEAFLLDSVCVTKFIYWLKHNVGKTEITELSAAAYIDNLRSQVPGFIELSFPTISGYGTNGAIVHYGATKESNTTVKPEGMLLVDSGGQYEKGTTDVTRTVACGPVNDKMKLCYSKVAVSMLTLANAKFLHGCTGRNLDTLARMPMWSMNMDYKHGTGHGVGYILNVHEGPQSIRWAYVEGAKEYPFESGMITSDEPGIYLAGEFGIRIENIILCVDDVTNGDGRFHKFEHLTFAPLDRSLLDVNVLSKSEIDMVNAYQKLVYEKMKGHLTKEEDEWLKNETMPL